MLPIAKTFIDSAKRTKQLCFDVEHDPKLNVDLKPFSSHGCSFATTEFSEYIKDKTAIREITIECFNDEEIQCIAFNGKYDIKCLRQEGILDLYTIPKNFADPMIAVNLLDDSRHPRDLSLKAIMLDYFKHRMRTFDEAIAFGLDSPEFKEYAIDDAVSELKLFNWAKPKLEEQDLYKVFSKILCKVSLVFADIELTGIKWNIGTVRPLLRGYQEIRDRLEEEILRELGPMNINSGDQLAKRLFEELGYSTKGIPMTEAGKRYKVDEAAMDVLAAKYPICKKIVYYRTACKIIGTYIEPLTRMALEDKDERIHPSYHLTSITGRTRCSDPNLQNQPNFLAAIFDGLSIRKNFIARPGFKFVVSDESQIELRLIGHASGDKVFIDAFNKYFCTACNIEGESIKILHSCPKCNAPENEKVLTKCPSCKRRSVDVDKKTKTCPVCRGEKSYEEAKIRGFYHGDDLHQITTDRVPALRGDRQNGKKANFALGYNATATRMNQEYPELSVSEWDVIRNEWLREYNGVKAWHDRCSTAMYNAGVVRDIFGRKRRISKREIATSAKHALNQFINFNPQASGCGILELAMVRMREEWVAEGTWLKEIFMVNMVHDELDFEIQEDKLDKYIPRIQYHMENVVQLKVPLRSAISVGDNWAEAKGK